MLYTTIAVFALAAIVGVVLISHVLKNKPVPIAAAIIHGLFAAVAIVLLILYTTGNRPGPIESLVLFIIAALGGFIMIARDISGKTVPKWLAVAHGLLAASALMLLLAYAIGR